MKLIFVNESAVVIKKTLFSPFLKNLNSVLGEIPEKEVELLLTDDETIQNLNRVYRDKDQPTDVLSFSAREENDARFSLGQIVISVDRAAEQAQELEQSLEEELCFLFVHGLLHLLGYDHETPEEEVIMLDKAYRLLGRK